MKKIFLFFNFLFFISHSFSQNLVPNPDFEIFGIVPCGWSNTASDFDAATDSWTSPTQATPDIFSTLISPSCINYQPHINDPYSNGWQPSHSGNIFAGFYTYVGGSTWREYLQVRLTQPMETGHAYRVLMYVSLGDNSQFATNNIGIGFSTTLTNSTITKELGYAPQINHTGLISDTSYWVCLADTIVATDEWEYLVIGNFFSDAATAIVQFNPGGVSDDTYYYVDDVFVAEINLAPSSLFAADETNVCEKFCTGFFDQSNNNPTAWQWNFPGGNPSSSTDENPANICYNSPGTYDVTLITTNANGSDTLTLPGYIAVHPTPPVPTITQNGYTLTSSPANSYQWQLNSVDIPGATDQSYTVIEAGLYTVITDDSNSCVNSANSYVLISGLVEVRDAGISIYPNPSTGNFMVEFSYADLVSSETENGLLEINVLNTLGQKVFSCRQKINTGEWTKQINLSDVTRGIYFIEIKTENDFARKKIVIAK